MWRTASSDRRNMRGGIARATPVDQPGGGRRIGTDGEQIRAHLIVKVAGEFAPLLLLQSQNSFIETAVLGGGCRQARRHSIETVAQASQFRRQPAADPGAVMPVADLLQRGSQLVERPQGAADKNIDQADREAAKHAEYREALGELVPHFEDLVIRIGLDHDRSVISIADSDTDTVGLRGYSRRDAQTMWALGRISISRRSARQRPAFRRHAALAGDGCR